MHPLQPNLVELSNEDLHKKYGDLMMRMTKSYQWGRPDMVAQLQLLAHGYKEEIDRRNEKALEEMQKHSKQFKNIIDIQ
jgi:hypothetical protein